MKFTGCLTFDGANVEGRSTNAASFPVISDWYQSVVDYYRQEVMTGNYDGFAVIVTILNSETYEEVHSLTIENPWRI